MGEEKMIKVQTEPASSNISVLDAQMQRKEELLKATEDALSLIEERIEMFTGIKPNDKRIIQEIFECKLERSSEANFRLQDILDRTNSIRYSLAETL